MIVDNQEAYETLSWILDNADSGFFIVTAPYQLQNELILRYETSKTAIYDYAKSENKFTFTELGEWADTCPDDEFLFIVNMQVIFNDENAMNSINLCRDMLASKNRAWLFFMTRDCEEMLAKNARDFYSYVRMKAYFKAEIERFNLISTEKVVNYDKAGEAIERYAEIEKSLMSLAIEDTPHDELATAAVTLSNLADLYKNYNDYDKALRISEKVILIREKVFGKEHPETAIAYNFIASIYFDRGDFSEAIKWINEDLMICLKVLGKKNINTAFAYNNIASIYKYMHGYEEALVFFEKARIICEEVQGKNHEDTASIYNNIADLYSYQGDYLRALEWCEKSLEIYEKVLGREHPKTANVYESIAFINLSLGEYVKAFEWYYKALNIREIVLGKEHLETAIIYAEIARAYLKQGDFTKALEFNILALPSFEKGFVNNEPKKADLYFDLAICYHWQEDYENANKWYEKALTIYENIPGEETNVIEIRQKINDIQERIAKRS